jgi:hypothetical protein
MQYQRSALDERKPLSEECVKDLSERDECDENEADVPALWLVVLVIEDRERGDLVRGWEGDGYGAGLPAEDAEPADDVGEELLKAGRGKFGDPVVLAAGCGGPGGVSCEVLS